MKLPEPRCGHITGRLTGLHGAQSLDSAGFCPRPLRLLLVPQLQNEPPNPSGPVMTARRTQRREAELCMEGAGGTLAPPQLHPADWPRSATEAPPEASSLTNLPFFK